MESDKLLFKRIKQKYAPANRKQEYIKHYQFGTLFSILVFNTRKTSVQFSSVQSLSRIRFFATPWITARQASLSIIISRSPPKPMSIESVMLSKHLILCHPFSFYLQSFPTSGSFPMSPLFVSCGQSIEASASGSLSPSSEYQGWFPLGLTGFVSLLSKGLSKFFSSNAVWKHQFFSLQPSLQSNSHIHTWLLEKL